MRPKQLLRLFDGQSLLYKARERLASLFAPENIWVITSAHYLDLVAEALPDLPRDNLIGEPVGRDTANAIGLAAHLLAQREPDSTMAVFTADHLITPQDRFDAAIAAGLDAAEQHPESLITFGIVPNTPHTGYGYVRRGAQMAPHVFRAAEFKEKPTQDVAEAYVASGKYYWNSGMFAWRSAAILQQLARHLPENDALLSELAQDWGAASTRHGAESKFERLPRISIDFGVMEKAEEVLLVEMDCRWLDLGSWSSIAATRSADESGNVTVAENVLMLDGQRNVVVADTDHLIAVLGAEDLIVVHSEDATLICHRDHEQRIRDVVNTAKERFGTRFD